MRWNVFGFLPVSPERCSRASRQASLYAWLGERGHLPDAGEESVVVGFPTALEQHHLAMSAAAPIVRLTRRATAGGIPVEYAEAVLPADRYELWFPLAAGPDGRLAAATGAP